MADDKKKKLPKSVSPDEADAWREQTLKSLKWYSRDGWQPGAACVSTGFYGCIGKYLCFNCGGYTAFTIVCPKHIQELWDGPGYQAYCNHCGQKHRIWSDWAEVEGMVNKVWTYQAEPLGDLQYGMRSKSEYGRGQGSGTHGRAETDTQETGDALPPAPWEPRSRSGDDKP